MFYSTIDNRCVDLQNPKSLIFPAVKDIRDVSARVATAVINLAIEENIATDKDIIDCKKNGGRSRSSDIHSRFSLTDVFSYL